MTGGMMFKGALLAALMATPALADGKEDTLAVISMTIAQNECGLMPDMASAETVAQRSMAFTGLDRDGYITAVSDAAAFKTKEMYVNRTIGKFCVDMARIYGGGK